MPRSDHSSIDTRAAWRGAQQRRAAAGWAALALAVTASSWLWLRADAQAQQDDGEQARGEAVYAATCAACHGPAGQGRSGDGVEAGPALRGLEVALVDQLVRTGRMPIRAPELGVNREELTAEEREALVAWMAERMDLVGDIPEVGEGDRTRGHELYAIYCSACHGATGQGGVGASGTVIRQVTGLDRVAVVEAIRVGPFDMPRFDEERISDEDAAAIAAFVDEDLSAPATTPLGLGEMHRVTFWGFASVLAVVLLLVVVLVAAPPRLPVTDDSSRAGREPEREP